MPMTRVVMPQLGESVHEGTISKWLVKPGDKVVEFEPMLEVDTDKVSAEVPSPVTGILREILAKEGETVQAGAEIAVVEVGGDGETAAPAPTASEPKKTETKKETPVAETAEAPAPAPTASEPKKTETKKATPAAETAEPPAPAPTASEPKETETKKETPVAETAEPPAPAPADGAAAVKAEAAPAPEAKDESPAEAPAPAPADGAAAVKAEAAPAPEAKDESPPEIPSPAQEEGPEPAPPLATGEHRYSPAVQMVASELKVDLSKISGTGIGGRVTKKDVQDFAASAKDAPTAPVAPSAAAAAGQGDQVVQLTRVRRLIAENMSRSKSTIPHAWQTQEADMSGVVANRAANKVAFQTQEGFSLTYLPYVMAAAVSALREHREVNSTFNETELIVHRDINLGVSVGLEDTLVVPVVRRADGLSIAGLARAVNDIATRARSKQLKADDLAGATFTVNNSGTFGTLFSYSVINPGQAGILTMEAIVDRPMAVGGMIGIKPMMYLCFSFDHRVLDGLQAARFLVSCRKWLEAVTVESPIY
jgi:pyruvate dehydrogenase E2 component (dihydrolipoamide acetyltransferase)